MRQRAPDERMDGGLERSTEDHLMPLVFILRFAREWQALEFTL
jgi:hypothetical protein